MDEKDLRRAAADFLGSGSFAVVGVSADPEKYGRKVYDALLGSGRRVYGVNPGLGALDGARVYPRLSDLPEVPEAVSVVVPPRVAEGVVEEAVRLGVRRVWMQPGAESPAAVTAARAAGMEVIGGEACVLVALSGEKGRAR